MPGYYDEKSGKAREKKAEMAAHVAAREASVAPLPGPAMSEKEAKEIRKNNNCSSLELNVGINEGEGLLRNFGWMSVIIRALRRI